MINLGISLAVFLFVAVGMSYGLGVAAFITIPFGLAIGVAVFIWLGRGVQTALEAIMAQMQKDIQSQKIDRAIETLKRGLIYKNRHIFVAGQINSQIGMLYYLKKDHDRAMEYFKKGFFKHFIAQGMKAAIQYKRKDYDAMKKTLEKMVSYNKKESICYGLHAYFLYQLKEKDKAIEVLQQGLKKLPDDERIKANLTQLQNNKKMRMKLYGEMWTQFMLERPPRMVQEQPRHMRVSRKSMFRGR